MHINNNITVVVVVTPKSATVALQPRVTDKTSSRWLFSQWGCSSVVERMLRMYEVPGSIPGISNDFFFQLLFPYKL